MQIVTDPLDYRLLDDWQRDFPVTTRPFRSIGRELGLGEAAVITRLTRLLDIGRISRVGATCAPNTVSASTLAAISAPEGRVEDVAAIIGAEAGVNHSYLRENAWNLWFVATGPDRRHVDATLARIRARSGLNVLDLRLVRAFNVDLGFRMSGDRVPPARRRDPADISVLRDGDPALLQALAEGLPLVPAPYEAVAARLETSESQVMERIRVLLKSGVLSRFGIIVRHRALGWCANAMVVWQVDPGMIPATGPELAAHPGVTLCYERRPDLRDWPYNLYCMIHARSRAEALETLDQVSDMPGLRKAPHEVLFSSRCFRQKGALISLEGGRAA